MPSLARRVLVALDAVLLVAIVLLAWNLRREDAAGRREAPPAGFVRGDANDDGVLDLTDGIFTLNWLFVGGEEPPCLAAADADDSATVDISDSVYVLNWLFRGGSAPPAPFPEAGSDPTPDLPCRGEGPAPIPPPGTLGGPDRELTLEEELVWRRGRQLFDDAFTVAEGLGPRFNGDSCRGCHSDPVVGGSGGMDLDVVRFAYMDEEGQVSSMPGGPVTSRLSVHGTSREEVPPGANVVETRQTPSLLGLGMVDRLPDEAILAHADPDDLDGDGISGRVRRVDGRIGRFGHKAGVPDLLDFTVDALANEIGITTDPALSPFAVAADEDPVPDPELDEGGVSDLAFFIGHLAPAPRAIPGDPVEREVVEDGEAVFDRIGCTDCHVPSLEGPDGSVPAYSDFLLHDVGDPERRHVHESGVDPREFRTAPLWGLRHTGPWLHDGSAETFSDAIQGHHGEANAARAAWTELGAQDRAALEAFLGSL